jgi:hypothetical protein
MNPIDTKIFNLNGSSIKIIYTICITQQFSEIHFVGFIFSFSKINKQINLFILVKTYRVVLARVPIIHAEDIIGLYLYIDEKKPPAYLFLIDRSTK